MVKHKHPMNYERFPGERGQSAYWLKEIINLEDVGNNTAWQKEALWWVRRRKKDDPDPRENEWELPFLLQTLEKHVELVYLGRTKCKMHFMLTWQSESQETKQVKAMSLNLTFIELLLCARVYVRLFTWLLIHLKRRQLKINNTGLGIKDAII